MESGYRSPLIDFFRRGEVARDVRLMAAGRRPRASRASEQLALLIFLSDDADPDIAASANATLDALAGWNRCRHFLARSDVPEQMRGFFLHAGRERRQVCPPPMSRRSSIRGEPTDVPDDTPPDEDGPLVLSSLSIVGPL
jgi:hypothetical protein